MAGKKSGATQNIIITENDKEVLAGVKEMRLITTRKLFEYVLEGRRRYTLQSLRKRMAKLEKMGFLESINIIPFVTEGDIRVINYEKAYRLTEIGLSIALDKLGLDYNISDSEGMIEKYHQNADEIAIHKQHQHHFHTQDVVIHSCKEIRKRIPSIAEDLFSLNHGYGREFSLYWNEIDGEQQKVRQIKPDWVFLKPFETKQKVFYFPICLEEDMITMRPTLLQQKFKNYLTHVEQNTEKYTKNPLHLVVSVLDVGSNKKRLRGIMSNAFTYFEGAMLKGSITVDVLSNSHSPSRIADLYEGTVVNHMPEFPELPVEVFLEGSKSGYRLLHVFEKDHQYRLRNLAFQPEFCIVFQRPNGEQLSVFLVSMRGGNVNSHAQLLHLQEVIEEAKLYAIVIGIYPSTDEMNEDVFMDFNIEKELYRRIIQLQPNVILSTEEELKEKRAYQVSTNLSRNNSQRLSVVTWKDVVRTN